MRGSQRRSQTGHTDGYHILCVAYGEEFPGTFLEPKPTIERNLKRVRGLWSRIHAKSKTIESFDLRPGLNCRNSNADLFSSPLARFGSEVISRLWIWIRDSPAHTENRSAAIDPGLPKSERCVSNFGKLIDAADCREPSGGGIGHNTVKLCFFTKIESLDATVMFLPLSPYIDSPTGWPDVWVPVAGSEGTAAISTRRRWARKFGGRWIRKRVSSGLAFSKRRRSFHPRASKKNSLLGGPRAIRTG